MNEKEQFDGFMRLAELRTLRATNRQNYEWKVTFGLWAVITAGTLYLKDRPVSLWLGPCIIFVYAFFWLRAIYVAHLMDNEAASFYIDSAIAVLAPGHKIQDVKVGVKLGWIPWLFGFLSEWGCLFQLLTTALLVYFFYLMTNPGALPDFLRAG